MILKTKRLLLRPWQEADAPDLYTYAKDGRVGVIAGWLPHKSVEESAKIIKTIFRQEGVYAATLKKENRAIGCVGVVKGAKSHFQIGADEGEISYWLGVPYWGRGFIPEAVKELIRSHFEEAKLKTLWGGYFDGNERSKRVLEKCGFTYHHTDKDMLSPYTNDIRTEHVMRLTKEEWMSSRLSG